MNPSLDRSTAGNAMWKRLFFVFAFLVVMLSASNASAQASCTISTLAVAFGNYNVFTATPDDANGRVTIRCNAAAANVSVTLSTGSSGTYAARTMTKGSENLSYNLYTDAARSTVWGNGSGGTSFYFNANPPNNQNVNINVFGRVPAGQDVSAGAYADTVSATVNF